MDASSRSPLSGPSAGEDQRLLALNTRLGVEWRDYLRHRLPDHWLEAVHDVENTLAGYPSEEWTDNLTSRPPTSRRARAIWNFVRVLCDQLPHLWIDFEFNQPQGSTPDGLTVVLEELTRILMAEQDWLLDDDQESSIIPTSSPGVSSPYTSSTASPRLSPSNTPRRPDATSSTRSSSNPRSAIIPPAGPPTLFSTMFPCQNCGRVHPAATPACARPNSLVAFVRRLLRRRDVDDWDNSSVVSDTRTHISKPAPPYERGDWIDAERPPSYVQRAESDEAGVDNGEAGTDQPFDKVATFRRLMSCAQRLNRDVYKQDPPTQQDLDELSDLRRQLCNEPPQASAVVARPPRTRAVTQAPATLDAQAPQGPALLSPFRRFVETAKTGRAIRKTGLDLRRLGRMWKLIAEGAEEGIPTEDMLAFSSAILTRARQVRDQSISST